MSEIEALRNKALALLAQREHSRHELSQKLARHAEHSETIATVLDELEARDWLSDARFAAAYVEAHAARQGRYRLEQGLRERGVAEQHISAALAATPELGSELERARAVWQKKFGQPPGDAQERARQARFLQSRGFQFETIRRVLALQDDE